MVWRRTRMAGGNRAQTRGVQGGLVLALSVTLLLAACGGRTIPAAARPDIVGYWQVTHFEQHDPKMYTCFGNDAAVEFRANGTWTGFNRADHHDTYAGTYAFSGRDQINLVAGVRQRYALTLKGDVITLRSGKALMILLQRTAAPAASSMLTNRGSDWPS